MAVRPGGRRRRGRVSLSSVGWAITTVVATTSSAAVATPWTALHQWTPLAANITLVRRPGDAAENISARWRLLHVTDTHISLGEASELHQTGTRRMHGAFRLVVDRHLEPGARRTPADTFRKLLELGSREQVDAIILGGDIVNFPHNASIHYVLQSVVAQRAADGYHTPILYTAGNHDWLVEGLDKSRKEQRSKFRRELLKPFYSPTIRGSHNKRAAHHPSPYSWIEPEDVGTLELCRPWASGHARSSGEQRLLLLALDNSHLEVSSAQADFIWRELARGLPTLLVAHVPFMLPNTPKNKEHVICGDPRYNHDGDTSWQLEKRERWPRGGAPVSTLRFVEDLVRRFAAPHGPLIGILGGHEHQHRVDTVGVTHTVPPLRLQCESSQGSNGEETPRCEHKDHGHRLGLPLHEGLVQYVTLSGLDGGHRMVEVRDARYNF